MAQLVKYICDLCGAELNAKDCYSLNLQVDSFFNGIENDSNTQSTDMCAACMFKLMSEFVRKYLDTDLARQKYCKTSLQKDRFKKKRG